MLKSTETGPFARINWAAAQPVGHTGRKLVLWALAMSANEDGYCYPSQSTLAKRCEFTRQTVNGHLAALRDDGFTATRHRHRKTDGGQSANEYLVLYRDGLTWPDGTAPLSETPTGGQASTPTRPVADIRHALSGASDTSLSAPADTKKDHKGGKDQRPLEQTTRTPGAAAHDDHGQGEDDPVIGLAEYITELGERGILNPEWFNEDHQKPEWRSGWREYVQAEGTEQVRSDIDRLRCVIDDSLKPKINRTFKHDTDWPQLLRGKNSVPTFIKNLEALRATKERFA